MSDNANSTNLIMSKSVCLGFEWAVRLTQPVLNIVGIWPQVHQNAYYKFLSDLRAMFSVLICILIGAIPALHALLRTWGDMMAMIDNLQFTLPLSTAIMKLAVIWWKKTDLTAVLNMVADDWVKMKTNSELRVMIKCAQSARLIAIIGYVLMGVGYSLIVFLPCFGKSMRYITNITDPGKTLPLQTYYPYDKDRSPYFELTFAAQAFILLLTIASYSGVDNLLGILIFHLCGQLKNLRMRLMNMKQFKSFNIGLAFVVQDHIRLIKYFDIVESTFTILLLGLLFYFLIIFCLCGFLLVTMLKQRNEMSIIRVIYLVSVVLNIGGHMCLYCAVGEILVMQCEGLYRAAYDCIWYILEPKEMRSLILVMIRASKSLHITAGKVFPMTMSMFCNIIKTSAGYISILLAKQD